MPQVLISLKGILALPTITLKDLDGDAFLDLIVAGGLNDGIDIYRGLGDGSFSFVDHFRGGRQSGDILVTDINGDGKLDIIVPSLTIPGGISVFPGNGDATFAESQFFFTGEAPIAITLIDWGSEIETEDGLKRLGPADGHVDLAVANSGASLSVAKPGPPEIVVLPQLLDENGEFAGFGAPHRIAEVVQPLDIEATDFNADGVLDLGVVDRGEFLALFSEAPQRSKHDSIATAQDLGVVVHLVEPTLTITPGNEEKFFKLTVPTEAVPGSRDVVMDISSGIDHLSASGIQMEVLDSEGHVLADGSRVRIRASQGSALYVHLFGIKTNGILGTGAYTLVINALPQVVSVEAPALLPGIGGKSGSSASSLVITFQGDRLEPSAAQDRQNYEVIYWGRDGIAGTFDDESIPIGGKSIRQPIVYDASANIDITSGLTYPTAVKQTVTLVFDAVLPVGSYTILLSDGIRSAAFNAEEDTLLSAVDRFGVHSLVQMNANLSDGARIDLPDLIQPTTALGDLSIFSNGTFFLTQLQNDLQALLDDSLSVLGDDPSITNILLDQIRSRVVPGIGPPSRRATSLLILFFDPFPFAITSRSTAGSVGYDRQTNNLERSISQAYVQVGRNLDFVVIPQAQGSYELQISNLPPLPRMGAVLLSQSRTDVFDLTADVRAGKNTYEFRFDVMAPATLPLKVTSKQQISANSLNTTIRSPGYGRNTHTSALKPLGIALALHHVDFGNIPKSKDPNKPDKEDEIESVDNLKNRNERDERKGTLKTKQKEPNASENGKRSGQEGDAPKSAQEGASGSKRPIFPAPSSERPDAELFRSTDRANEIDAPNREDTRDRPTKNAAILPAPESNWQPRRLEFGARLPLFDLSLGYFLRNSILAFWSLFK